MNFFADDLMVALLLALSLVYVAMKLGPRAVRRKLQAAAALGLAAAPAIFRLRGIAQRLATASLQQTKGACGGCDSCEPPRQVAEVVVPLAKIGRRDKH